MSSSGPDKHLVAAFVSGAAIIPAMVVLAWAWLSRSSPEPCSQFSGPCFRGLVEALMSGIAAAVVTGVVAQHLARDGSGWLAMMGGLVAAAVVASGSSVATFGGVVLLLAIPATIGYFVIGGLSELGRDAPGQSAGVGSASEPAAESSRDRADQCDSCCAPLDPHARSCLVCGSPVLE